MQNAISEIFGVLCIYRAVQIIQSPPIRRVSNRDPGGFDGATQEAVAYIALI